MKKKILQSVTVLTIIIIGSVWSMQRVHAEGWEKLEGGFDYSGVLSNIRLAIHPTTGESYVAFSDYGTWKARVKKYSNDTWQTVGDDNFGPPFSSVDSLAINPKTGEPYVAIRDYTNGRKVTVMKFDDNSWQTVGNAGFGSEVVGDIILAFNPKTGEPCVAYESIMDKGYGWVHYQPAVMRFNNGSWQAVGATTFTEGDTLGMALAFNPTTGEPYIAYSDSADSWKTNVKKFSDGSWQTVASPNLSVGMQQSTSLFFNPVNSELYMAYNDYGDSHNQHAAVIKFNGESWQPVGGYNDFTGEARYISLAFQPIAGEPYIAYSDYSNDGKAIVKKFSNGSWQTIGSDGLSTGRADYVSLMFNPISMEPYVAFSDVDTISVKSSPIVMKYVGDTPSPPPVTPTHTVAYIPVKFSDGSASIYSIEELEKRADLVEKYYKQQSSNAVNIKSDFIKSDENERWFTLKKTLAQYEEAYPTKSGCSLVNNKELWSAVRKDAITNAEEKTKDTSKFDDENYKAIVVIQPECIQSFADHKMENGILLADKEVITTEKKSFATWAHELGHSLFQFADYHGNAEGGSSHGEVGYWDLMGRATLANPSAPLMSLNRKAAGWRDYSFKPNGTYQIGFLNDSNTKDKAILYDTDKSNDVDYYILEGRNPKNEFEDGTLKDNTLKSGTYCSNYDYEYKLKQDEGVLLYKVTNDKNSWTKKPNVFIMPNPGEENDANKVTLTLGSSYQDDDGEAMFSLTKNGDGEMEVKIDSYKPKNKKKVSLKVYFESKTDPNSCEASPTENLPDLDLHVISNNGRKVGMNYDTGEYEMQIDGVSTSYNIPGGGPEWISIPDNVNASYYVDATPLKKWAEETGANVSDIKADFRVTTFDENGNRQDSEEMTVPIDLTNPVTPLAIEADVEMNPKTLNLKSNGNWITAYVELPGEYDIRQIISESAVLNNHIKADKVEFGDFDSDGIVEAMMKFDRAQIASILAESSDKKVTINGDFMHDGIPLPFVGESFFNTINPGSNPKK